jgi:hypothetical protein
MIRLSMMQWWLLALIFAQDPNPPAQPIPFSHKTHVGIPLKCGDCHTMPDPGDAMTIPDAAKCMTCHRTVKTESASIRELKAYADGNRAIPWVRIYEIPGWVFFSHKTHLNTGAECKGCHGAVAERDKLWREKDLSMRFCMDCHRGHQATVDCNGCHEAK